MPKFTCYEYLKHELYLIVYSAISDGEFTSDNDESAFLNSGGCKISL